MRRASPGGGGSARNRPVFYRCRASGRWCIADHAVCLAWRGKGTDKVSSKQADGAAQEYPAVTLAVTKSQNAVQVADAVIARMEA